MIVDDEAPLRRVLRTSLAASGFAVSEAIHGEQALELAAEKPFDLVLLDINMPGLGGLETCRRLRKLSPRTGIVMVTVSDFEDDKVQALESGADDFVTKPFRLRELVARLRAVLRRLQQEPARPAVYRPGDLEIDVERKILRKNGAEIHLSPTEFDLLALLVQSSGAPLTHRKLLQSVWGPEYGGELEYLRSYMRMLRKKIEDDPSHPRYILTEPWVGYRFRNPSDPDAPASDEE